MKKSLSLLLAVLFAVAGIAYWISKTSIDQVSYSRREGFANTEDQHLIVVPDLGPFVVEKGEIKIVEKPVRVSLGQYSPRKPIKISGNILFDAESSDGKELSFLKIVVTPKGVGHSGRHISTDTCDMKTKGVEQGVLTKTIEQAFITPKRKGFYRFSLIEWIHGNFDFKKCKLLAYGEFEVIQTD